ncbi:homoserine dehydrogenase [Halobacillus sp. BBL2006]|uniref:homoserine dehydrogenase n=1 Tax=Halobacillus sp. BBL2006 TaxID=1543706 RepID=UPI000542A4B8|nr:homoserine dehydrogenase [Halobacillus sp. BBL2006]KHE72810.1 homoserine dehydrogenase [Halobacillus sp. BBL2006]
MTTKLAFIGFGGVGQALAEIVLERKEMLENQHHLDVSVVAVADMMKGSVYHPDGLDISKLLSCVRENGSVETYPEDGRTITGWTNTETIIHSNADVIVEVTYTDVKTGEPAITHCRTAFKNKKSVITTNKGPVALAYEELSELAKAKGVFFGFEGTVMSGTPALRMPKTTLLGNEIKEIKGILNGTTNYMITEMEKGLSYQEALEKAQQLGYAEADPTSDVEGYDARYKTAILSNYVMGVPISHKEVGCEGISGLTVDDVQSALNQGQKYRLLARITRRNGSVEASVKPERIAQDDPLAGVTGATNAIVYECDLAGSIMLTGAGAGLKETGYSLLIDLIHFNQQRILAKT